MGDLARVAAVTAAVLAEYGDALDEVFAVDFRRGARLDTGAVVSLQMRARPSWEQDVLQLARVALALGMGHVELRPIGGYVRMVAVDEVSTSVGTARVEVWDHLTGEAVGRAAAVLGVALCPDTGAVELPAAEVAARVADLVVGAVA
ncbi:hypothetical protein ACFXGA_00485 [Actinosynnema sp. NPDC059335]|uniref:hypothetical protein n=1 Tax=Actinosynnema sp. NPDC059335 TaxID=3346804 RepID=UPI00366AF4A9